MSFAFAGVYMEKEKFWNFDCKKKAQSCGISKIEMSEIETSPVAEKSVWDGERGRGGREPRDKVCVEERSAHLVHVELALPSSQLSVAGCEVPDEVVAGSMNKSISEYI